MIDSLRSAWAAHPWLTAVEGLVALLTAVELVFLVHVIAGWLWGVVAHQPYAMIEVRFVFMTGADAQFGAGFFGLLALLPGALLLVLVGGVGWAHAAWVHAPTEAFLRATLGGVGVLALGAVALFLSGNVFGGGIVPH